MRQITDKGAASAAKEARPSTSAFYAVIPSTKDIGRVILGGGFAGVSDTGGKKVRAVDEYQLRWLHIGATAPE